MTPDITRLLFGACLLLMGLACAALMLLRAQARQKALQLRVSGVALQYAPTRLVGASHARRLKEAVRLGERTRAAWMLIGYDPEKRAQYKLPPGAVLGIMLVPARGIAWVLGLVVGAWAWLIVPLAWFFLCRAYWRHYDSRRAGKLYVQLPDALAMIVRAVRVGIPVTEAFRTVSRESPEPTAEEFGRLSDRLRIGVPLEEALTEVAARVRLAEYRFFATAMTLQSQTGGGLTETLETLADVIRKRIALRNRAHALSSEARTSAIVLAALPVVVATILMVMNPDYMTPLITDGTGRIILGAGLGMLATGGLVMRQIIRASLR